MNMAKAGKLDKSSEPLSVDMLHKMNAYFSAANYLSVGQIYLFNNPLLREPLKPDDIKPRLLGHWGTTPGLNFVYVHMNRVIKKYDLDMIFVTGPGHGGPALVANTYLEGTYSEFYPNVSEDEEGMKKLFTQFSFPGGIPSHTAAETPGSINEGGELGYSLSHAFGAAFDNPDLIVTCVVGDGEAGKPQRHEILLGNAAGRCRFLPLYGGSRVSQSGKNDLRGHALHPQLTLPAGGGFPPFLAGNVRDVGVLQVFSGDGAFDVVADDEARPVGNAVPVGKAIIQPKDNWNNREKGIHDQIR